VYGFDLDIHIWITIGLIPIWLTAMIRTLKFIGEFDQKESRELQLHFQFSAICSTAANFCMSLGILCTIGYIIPGLPSFTERSFAASYERIPTFFGIVLFTFEGIALVLPLKNAMKKPRNFSKLTGVLNVGMTVATCIFLVIGVLGYWRYGEETSGSITMNLDPDNM
jgi:solute carrier family 36 (proton-coupled amino acid transporter)